MIKGFPIKRSRWIKDRQFTQGRNTQRNVGLCRKKVISPFIAQGTKGGGIWIVSPEETYKRIVNVRFFK
ncbi:hypothetical protein B9K06_17970 [Bacillus sp. OG2]|nr:hypothetical protein B9K06_17970 [Bacillus sp. OG2]